MTTDSARKPAGRRRAPPDSRLMAALSAAGDARRRWAKGRDGPVLIALVLAVVLTRLPRRSHYLNAWDSTSFALALDRFDVVAQRPHAPGYPVYVALGKLLRPIFGDANTTLVAVSILFSAAAVAALYGFLREFASMRAALGATALFLLTPFFVFNGLIALSYTSEAFASAGLAWLAWRHLRAPSIGSAIILGAAWALGAGLRQSLALFLGPLVAFALIAAPGDLRTRGNRVLASAASATVVGLAWAVPMWAATTGGYAGWGRATSLQGSWVIFAESFATRGLTGVAERTERLLFFLSAERAYLVPAALLLTVLAFVASRRGRGTPRAPQGFAVFMASWTLPSLLFYVLVFDGWDRGPTGYVLVLLPPVYAAFAVLADVAVGAVEARPRRPWMRPFAAVVALPLLLVPGVGLHHDWDPWIEREVADHDAWAQSWERLRAHLPPNETAILAWYSWAHVKWYFPDYVVWGYFPIPRDAAVPDWELVLETRQHEDDVLYYEAHDRGPDQPRHLIPHDVRTIVVFDFQLAGENGGPRRLHDDVQVEEAFLDGWRVLLFHPDPTRPAIEDYLRPIGA